MSSSINLINHLLPNEVLFQVFSNLVNEDKKHARMVCHRWRRLLDWDLTFRPKVTNRSMKRFIQSYRRMETATISGLTNRLPRLSHPKNELPVIKNIVFMGSKNSEANIMNFLKYGCKQVESLLIPLKTLARVRTYVLSGPLPNMNWYTLSKLELQVQFYRRSKHDMKHLKSSSTFLKFAKILSLRDFKFEFTTRIAWKKCKSSQRVIQNFLIFILANASSLKKLDYLVRCNKVVEVIHGNIIDIRAGLFLLVKTPKMDALLEEIGRTMRLESIRVEFDAVLRIERMIWPEFFGSHLQELEIIIGRSYAGKFLRSPLNHGVMNRIFEANSKTLEKVTLGIQDFDISWLQNCSALKTFNLELRGKGLSLQSNGNPNSYQLKSISLAEFIAADWPRLKQLILENAGTLEKVEMFLEDCDYAQMEHDWNWMNQLVHLKSLGFHWNYLDVVQREIGDLPILNNLTELDISQAIPRQDQRQMPYWIHRTMPNLQKLHLPNLRVQALEIYLGVEQLRTISFKDSIQFSAEDNTTESEIYNFCHRTPGLHLTIEPRKRKEPRFLFPRDTETNACFLSIEKPRG